MSDGAADDMKITEQREKIRERFDAPTGHGRRASELTQDHARARVLRAAPGQVEYIPDAGSLPPGQVPPAAPLHDYETGAVLPELAHVVIRAGVSDEEAAGALLWMARYLLERAAKPSEPQVDPNEDTVPF